MRASADRPRRILILGGTGFIGSRLVAALAGHELCLLHRSPPRTGDPGVRHLIGDRARLRDHNAVLDQFRPEIVIDMLAQNAEAVRPVLECGTWTDCRFVMVSSASVYRQYGVFLGIEPGPAETGPADESAPLRSVLYPYRGPEWRPPDDPQAWRDGYDKIPAERAYRAARPDAVSILRLPLVWGPGDPDGKVQKYLRLMRDGASEIQVAESAAGWRNARGHVANIAQAIAAVALDPDCGVYNLADPGDEPEADWIGRIGHAAGWSGRVVTVADGAPDAVIPLDEAPPTANYAQHLRLDTAAVREMIGYTETVSVDDGLSRTAHPPSVQETTT